jgi:hypothetical protein
MVPIPLKKIPPAHNAILFQSFTTILFKDFTFGHPPFCSAIDLKAEKHNLILGSTNNK